MQQTRSMAAAMERFRYMTASAEYMQTRQKGGHAHPSAKLGWAWCFVEKIMFIRLCA